MLRFVQCVVQCNWDCWIQFLCDAPNQRRYRTQSLTTFFDTFPITREPVHFMSKTLQQLTLPTVMCGVKVFRNRIIKLGIVPSSTASLNRCDIYVWSMLTNKYMIIVVSQTKLWKRHWACSIFTSRTSQMTWTTSLSGVTRVCQPKETVSSTICKYCGWRPSINCTALD